MNTYTTINSVFDGPITNVLPTLCILIELLSRTHTYGAKKPYWFQFGTFIGRFLSDGASSLAVKGLKERKRQYHVGQFLLQGKTDDQSNTQLRRIILTTSSS